MRTTVEIDADIMKELRDRGHREGLSLRKILNTALRRGLAAPPPLRSRSRYKCPSVPMGQPLIQTINLNKALALSGALEDAEVASKLELRK